MAPACGSRCRAGPFREDRAAPFHRVGAPAAGIPTAGSRARRGALRALRQRVRAGGHRRPSRPRARRRPGGPLDPLRLPALLAAVHPARRGRGSLPGRAGPLRARPGAAADGGAVGRPADPGAHRIPLPAQRCRRRGPARVGAFYPSPAGATRVAARAGQLGGGGGRATRCSARPSRTSRRCSCSAPSRTRGSRPSSCRSTPATSWSARVRMPWRGFDGGEEAREEIDGFFDGPARTERGSWPAMS